MIPAALRAEEGKEAEHRDGGRKEGERKDGERHDDVREWSGTFSKGADGTASFKSGDTSYAVVVGQGADDGTKEKLANVDTLVSGNAAWVVKGATRKDSGGKDWIAVDWVGKKEGGDADPVHKDGDDRKREGERRKHRKEGGDHK